MLDKCFIDTKRSESCFRIYFGRGTKIFASKNNEDNKKVELPSYFRRARGGKIVILNVHKFFSAGKKTQHTLSSSEDFCVSDAEGRRRRVRNDVEVQNFESLHHEARSEQRTPEQARPECIARGARPPVLFYFNQFQP